MKRDISELSSQYFEATYSSENRNNQQNSSFQSSKLVSDFTSDVPSTDQSRRASHSSQGGRENIKLLPMKYQDLMQALQASPQYKGKSPIMLSMKESEIDKIIEKQHYHKTANAVSPQRSPRNFIQLSPMTLKQPVERDYHFERLSFEPEYKSPHQQTSPSDHKLTQFHRESNPPLGENQAQVYAMTGIQAYPMIGANNSAFKRRNRTPRKTSRRIVKNNRKKTRSRSRRPKSKSRLRQFRSKSRGRSKLRHSPRPEKIMRVQSSRRKPRPESTVIVRRKRRPVDNPSFAGRRRLSPTPLNSRYCTPYPLCDYDCTPYPVSGRLLPPQRRSSRPLISQSTAPAGMPCNCTLCEEKLQFIQPGVCSQKKDTWTNEYAIIPKPQINLIDPCKELDSSIYPRADRPCIRDGRGNPLTDCIGRPLRDPVGKRFLNFNANGSVMDTNFRGNFFTGQPPLCVKCPMPGRSCAPDTTHNWWMSCGYPVKANMGPFFNSLVAAENTQKRC